MKDHVLDAKFFDVKSQTKRMWVNGYANITFQTFQLTFYFWVCARLATIQPTVRYVFRIRYVISIFSKEEGC